MASQVSRLLASIRPHPQTFYATADPKMNRSARRSLMTREMKTRRKQWIATNRIKGHERTKRRPQLLFRPARNFTPPSSNTPYVKEKKDK